MAGRWRFLNLEQARVSPPGGSAAPMRASRGIRDFTPELPVTRAA